MENTKIKFDFSVFTFGFHNFNLTKNLFHIKFILKISLLMDINMR